MRKLLIGIILFGIGCVPVSAEEQTYTDCEPDGLRGIHCSSHTREYQPYVRHGALAGAIDLYSQLHLQRMAQQSQSAPVYLAPQSPPSSREREQGLKALQLLAAADANICPLCRDLAASTVNVCSRDQTPLVPLKSYLAQIGLAPSSGGLSTETLKGNRFCPVGGERFTEAIKFCPNHGAELRVRLNEPQPTSPPLESLPTSASPTRQH